MDSLQQACLYQAWEKRLAKDEKMPAHIGYEAQKFGKQGDRVYSLQSSYEAGFDPETDQLKPVFDSHNIWPTLEEFEAAVPEEIRHLLTMDHRRLNRAQKKELRRWWRGPGRRLANQFGLRGTKRW